MIGSGVSRAYVNDALAAYAVSNVLDGDPMYIGKVTATGVWLLMRYSTSAGTMLYANQSNNSAVTTYNAAWAARATLTYAAFDALTGV
jgi:IMP cyclohydrolase